MLFTSFCNIGLITAYVNEYFKICKTKKILYNPKKIKKHKTRLPKTEIKNFEKSKKRNQKHKMRLPKTEIKNFEKSKKNYYNYL